MDDQSAPRVQPGAPDWFRHALAQRPERSFTGVEGAAIETLAWGPVGAPGILLIHGSRASAEWWAFVAPLLMTDYRVAAFSMSGMGLSDHRPAYGIRQYGREAIAVARATGLFDAAAKPVVLGHSFGGYAALAAGRDGGDRIGGVVLVDSLIDDLSDTGRRWAAHPSAPRRSYPSLDAALDRFRLIPPQPTDYPCALDHVARASIMHDPAANDWTWRFDPMLFARMQDEDLGELARTTAPLAIVRGEQSMLPTLAVGNYLVGVFGDRIPDIVVPDAGHHIMIDRPLALVAALRALLAVWPAGTAPRRSRLGIAPPE